MPYVTLVPWVCENAKFYVKENNKLGTKVFMFACLDWNLKKLLSLKKSVEVHFNRSEIFPLHFHDAYDVNPLQSGGAYLSGDIDKQHHQDVMG